MLAMASEVGVMADASVAWAGIAWVAGLGLLCLWNGSLVPRFTLRTPATHLELREMISTQLHCTPARTTAMCSDTVTDQTKELAIHSVPGQVLKSGLDTRTAGCWRACQYCTGSESAKQCKKTLGAPPDASPQLLCTLTMLAQHPWSRSVKHHESPMPERPILRLSRKPLAPSHPRLSSSADLLSLCRASPYSILHAPCFTEPIKQLPEMLQVYPAKRDCKPTAAASKVTTNHKPRGPRPSCQPPSPRISALEILLAVPYKRMKAKHRRRPNLRSCLASLTTFLKPSPCALPLQQLSSLILVLCICVALPGDRNSSGKPPPELRSAEEQPKHDNGRGWCGGWRCVSENSRPADFVSLEASRRDWRKVPATSKAPIGEAHPNSLSSLEFANRKLFDQPPR
ncbi:hypothetical protein BDZ45DRAFT_719735 [Acephala macrosclerotiorum]|nr:hypothetical protein BDZ45DRAFT_719735 [Acephala macrosclerotiorum]